MTSLLLAVHIVVSTFPTEIIDIRIFGAVVLMAVEPSRSVHIMSASEDRSCGSSDAAWAASASRIAIDLSSSSRMPAA